MTQKITVECPVCHHQFEVDLDDHQPVQTVYRNHDTTPETVKEYRFRCPEDGTYFIVPVTITED